MIRSYGQNYSPTGFYFFGHPVLVVWPCLILQLPSFGLLNFNISKIWLFFLQHFRQHCLLHNPKRTNKAKSIVTKKFVEADLEKIDYLYDSDINFRHLNCSQRHRKPYIHFVQRFSKTTWYLKMAGLPRRIVKVKVLCFSNYFVCTSQKVILG